MKRDVFLTTLKLLDVKEKGGEFRIKGFLLEFILTPTYEFVALTGKIPYSLAKAIYEQHERYSIDMDREFNRPIEDKNSPFEKLYIDQIKFNSPEALKFVVETVREHPFINEWAIGNY